MTVVRVARAAEVPLLGAALAAPPDVYPWLFGEQQRGAAVLLLALDGGRPVGSALLRWTAADEVVRYACPGQPQLTNLQVAEAERGRGHGTALVEAVAAAAAAAGHSALGLGVADDNPDAARLYLQLGFAETGLRYVDRYTWTDAEGVAHDAADAVRHLERPSS